MDDDSMFHPNYIGVVTGAEWKVDEGAAVEYALVLIDDHSSYTFAASDGDLRALAQQIIGLVGE